jgi:hypothetical protein
LLELEEVDEELLELDEDEFVLVVTWMCISPGFTTPGRTFPWASTAFKETVPL